MKNRNYFGLIYSATNKINGKVYIGQTIKTLEKRMNAHLNISNRKNPKIYFHRALKHYGLNSFSWKILKYCYSREQLNKNEILFIKKFKSNNYINGYNLNAGGDGQSGFKHSKKTKEMISIKGKGQSPPIKGKKHSLESRLKMSKSRKGRKLSEEHKNNISKARKGWIFSLETRKKISIANKNKDPEIHKWSEKRKKLISKKFSGGGNPFYGKRHSEEAKHKMRMKKLIKYEN